MGPADGGKLGAAIADLVGRAVVQATEATTPGVHAARQAQTTAFMETLESELAPLCRDLFGPMVEHEDCPETFRTLYAAATGPTHQSDVILQILALFGLALSAPFAAAAGQLQALKNQSMERQQSTPLSPEAAATLAARGWIDPGFGAQEALYNGMANVRYQAMLQGSKHAPDTGTLMSMLDRKLIGPTLFESGLKDAGIREDWWGLLNELTKRPIGAGTAVQAAVESHIDMGQLTHLLELNGYDGAYAQLWFDTQGRPPGIHELMGLVNRGVFSLDELAQAIRESDIKTKYIPQLEQLRFHYPPMRSVIAMLAAGAIDQTTAARWLTYDGVHPDAVDALITEALNRKHEKVRDLSLSQVLSMYTDLEIDEATARQHLAALGYDQAETDLLVAHQDHERERKLQMTAVRRVERMTVAGVIDDQGARERLTSLDVAPEQADLLLRYWTLERGQQVATLTVAQLGAAAKARVIDETEFRVRVQVHGYDDHDTDVLWTLYTKVAPGQVPG